MSLNAANYRFRTIRNRNHRDYIHSSPFITKHPLLKLCPLKQKFCPKASLGKTFMLKPHSLEKILNFKCLTIYTLNRVNFKKNEKHYDSTKSAVFKMLQEVDQEPELPVVEADYSARQVTPATADKMFPLPQIQVNNRGAIEIPIIQMNRPVQLSPPTFPAANNTNGTYFSSTTTVKQQPSMPPGLRSVQAPVSKPAPTVPAPVPVNPHCAECDRPIV